MELPPTVFCGCNQFSMSFCWYCSVFCEDSVVPLKCGHFFQKYSQKTPHSLPGKARYEASFVSPASEWYSASVPEIIYAISDYIWPRYNGTWPCTVCIYHVDHNPSSGNIPTHQAAYYWSRISLQQFPITLGNPFAYPGINKTRPFCYLRGTCSFRLI